MPGSALRILIVEDHLLIARQLELIAASAGHEIVGTAATGEEACALAQTTDPDIVFLDVSLGGPSSGVDVAGFLAEQSRAHVVFTTANRRRLPSDLCGAIGVVEKPFTRSGLLSALKYISARMSDACDRLGTPVSLELSPAFSARWQSSNS